MSAPTQRYRFSVDDYHKLAEPGVLGEDARVELLEEEMVRITPIGLRPRQLRRQPSRPRCRRQTPRRRVET